MSPTWHGDPPPEPRPTGPDGWLRAIVKGTLIGIVVSGGLVILLLLRLPERLLHGVRRPWTPAIPMAVCRAALAIIGLRPVVEGQRLSGHGALVANHVSWLDILVLNGTRPLFFVAKSEVAGWPGIGPLARAAGTVFIRRDRADAARQRVILRERIARGDRLLFFPEGTSTDGLRVLDFRPTLFAAFFDEDMPEGFAVQPVSVVYSAPPREDPRFYGWWGDMGLGSHLLTVLAAPRQGAVRVVFHEPMRVRAHPGRKALARAAETAVREGFERA